MSWHNYYNMPDLVECMWISGNPRFSPARMWPAPVRNIKQRRWGKKRPMELSDDVITRRRKLHIGRGNTLTTCSVSWSRNKRRVSVICRKLFYSDKKKVRKVTILIQSDNDAFSFLDNIVISLIIIPMIINIFTILQYSNNFYQYTINL